MSFEWLEKFRHGMPKDANYSQKTLAAYALGIRAKGAIAGVRVCVPETSCSAAKRLDNLAIYQPEAAPRLPLTNCEHPDCCACVYSPVMKYERSD